MVDLTKLRNIKTGRVHISETGIQPSCREIKKAHILLFEETEHDKVNCKYCLKLLKVLFLDEDRNERVAEIMGQTFIPYNDNYRANEIT